LLQVVLDGNFIFAALKYKLDIRDRISKLLQNEEVRLFILQSSLTEMELVGEKAASSIEFAKLFCDIIADKNFQGTTAAEKALQFLGLTL